jgi:hypothetical protein
LMCLKMGNPWGIPQMATLILGTWWESVGFWVVSPSNFRQVQMSR